MTQRSAEEKQLYPRVQKWARSELGCWRTGVDTGPQAGRVDVVGLRDFGGGDLSLRTEVVAIEVKLQGAAFGTALGQTLGYSVMADRCVLAQVRPQGFSLSQMAKAEHLGLGLAQVDGKSISLVLSPGRQTPLPDERLQVLEKLGCGECTMCGSVFPIGEEANSWSRVKRLQPGMQGIAQAAQENKGLMWYLESAEDLRDVKSRGMYYWRRYLCPDCTRAISPSQG